MTETSKITMYGADWCRDCIRSKGYLDSHGIGYEYIDLEAVPEAAEQAKGISGRTNIPVIVFPDGTHQVEPTDLELANKLTELGLGS